MVSQTPCLHCSVTTMIEHGAGRYGCKTELAVHQAAKEGLQELPGSAVAAILQHLCLVDLQQMDTATRSQIPVVRERMLQMRYAGRWLQLTRRMPGVGRTSCAKDPVAISDHCRSDLHSTGSDYQADFSEQR